MDTAGLENCNSRVGGVVRSSLLTKIPEDSYFWTSSQRHFCAGGVHTGYLGDNLGMAGSAREVAPRLPTGGPERGS